MKKSGSALLIVIIFIAISSVLIFNLWYKNSLYLDLVNQQVIYYKHYYLAETLFNYAINYTKNNYETIKKSNQNLQYSLNHLIDIINSKFNKNKFENINAYINFVNLNKQNRIFLNLKLEDIINKKNLVNLSCEIEKLNETKYAIKNYNIRATV
ncbi:MAG: hypothetical protein SZ59_C0001G0078 [candidate division TM6 bacterium GW2011_GWF2_28_16]|nr:MAG: hypothetical protein SZ59_C0001G0078 [candidate division TM6 bacterium GW2011_GWF2_28_16]